MNDELISSNSHQNLIQDMIQSIDRFEFIMNHQEFHLDDYCSKLKNKIDIHREELIQQIFKKSAEMIKKIDDYYEKCKKNLSSLTDITLFNKQRLEKLKSEIVGNEKKLELVEKNLKENELLMIEYENMLKMNKNLEFIPCFCDDFGEFIIDEIDNENSVHRTAKLKYVKSFAANFFSQSVVMEVIECGKLAAGNFDGEICIFNYDTGKSIHTFKAHYDRISAIKSIDKYRLATGSFDKTIKIWDLNTYKCLHIFTDHRDRLNSLCLSKINNYLISGSDDKTIKIWSLVSNSLISSINDHSESVVHVRLNSKNMLISCSLDRTIKLWNLNTFKCEKTIPELDIWRLELTNTDKILTVSLDNIKLWDDASGSCMTTFEVFNSKGFIGKVKILNMDDYFIGYQNFDNGKKGETYKITIWKLSEQKQIYETNGYGRIESIEILNNGDIVCLNSYCLLVEFGQRLRRNLKDGGCLWSNWDKNCH